MKYNKIILIILVSLSASGCFSDGEVNFTVLESAGNDVSFSTFNIESETSSGESNLCTDFNLIGGSTGFTSEEITYWEEKASYDIEDDGGITTLQLEEACGGEYLSNDYVACSLIISNSFQDWGNYTAKEEIGLNLYYQIPAEIPLDLIDPSIFCDEMKKSIARDSGSESEPVAVSILVEASSIPYQDADGNDIELNGSYCIDYSFDDAREMTDEQMEYIIEQTGITMGTSESEEGGFAIASYYFGKSCAQLKGSNTDTSCPSEYSESDEELLSSLEEDDEEAPGWFLQDGADTLKVGFYTYGLEELSEEVLEDGCDNFRANPFTFSN